MAGFSEGPPPDHRLVAADRPRRGAAGRSTFRLPDVREGDERASSGREDELGGKRDIPTAKYVEGCVGMTRGFLKHMRGLKTFRNGMIVMNISDGGTLTFYRNRTEELLSNNLDALGFVEGETGPVHAWVQGLVTGDMGGGKSDDDWDAPQKPGANAPQDADRPRPQQMNTVIR